MSYESYSTTSKLLVTDLNTKIRYSYRIHVILQASPGRVTATVTAPGTRLRHQKLPPPGAKRWVAPGRRRRSSNTSRVLPLPAHAHHDCEIPPTSRRRNEGPRTQKVVRHTKRATARTSGKHPNPIPRRLLLLGRCPCSRRPTMAAHNLNIPSAFAAEGDAKLGRWAGTSV